VRKPARTSFDKLYEEMVNEAKGKKKSFKDDKGKRSVYYGADDNEETTKMDFLPTSKLKDIAKDRIEDLDERKKKRKTKKKKKKKKNPDYFKGTKKSNKQMDYEIGKCSVPNPPKSCYDEWTADKTYKKSKKSKMSETREIIKDLIIEAILNEKKKKKKKKKKKSSKKLSAKTRKTLRDKAKKANMPTGALTSVYRKGLAAWLTGHRQGVAQHQWAMGRVNSFIRGGKTRSVDKAEWKRVQKHRKKK